MSVLKGFAGNPTVSVNGKSRAFNNYGVLPAQFQAVANRTMVLEDGTADAITIVTPPARGKLVARADGHLSLNLNEVRDTTPLSIVYDKTAEGNIDRIDATIEVVPAEWTGGWSRPMGYFLETDPVYDFSLITSYKLEFVVRAALQRKRQVYTMRIQDAEIFFATPEDEARFIAANSQREADAGHEPR